ncbi:hypothetical protein GCM10010313_81970 [Streptomyces violarus]|uniref:Uncharacterized protein n=1 Tax=Streptomyces violarus TaxID=67380 RepID=A0A7W5F6H3_9ACTN|nr:hypothetical protein [Streptomyces violarus]MBB3081663.1 hypothetical protein [Streptomyces violarus]GHD34935.1 hypothetical protein GCM10010313_81970 [Streptomyces violarus]
MPSPLAAPMICHTALTMSGELIRCAQRSRIRRGRCCLLSLADSSEGAQWWWQFAAGAGNATAAHCLHLFHLGRGELRDADHWAHQAVTMDTHVPLTPFSRRRTPRHRTTLALREAVGRLQVSEVEEWGFQVFRPDSHLAHQIEELADAP